MSDTATFATSNTTGVSLSATTEVNGIVFNAGASPFLITARPALTLTLSGAGITNTSGITQNFVASVTSAGHGTMQFTNSATAGSNTAFLIQGGADLFAGAVGGVLQFLDSSTAGSGTFTINGPAVAFAQNGTVEFHNTSTAGNGSFTINSAPFLGATPGNVTFFDTATAGNGSLTTAGGTVSGGTGGDVLFSDSSTAGSATITNNGGTTTGGVFGAAEGGVTRFVNSSTAGAATLIANGGTGGGKGGAIWIFGSATGGTATVKVFGNGNLDISVHAAPGVTIGSLEGDGKVFLGSSNLTVGSNDLSKVFSGVISDVGGASAVTGGSLTKIGAGTLTLSGANTYPGPTLVSGGKLLVNGSLAGVSAVSVAAGATLGGSGTVGAATFANNAILAPGTSPGTFTTGTLIFNNLSQLNFELGTPNVVGGVTNDLTVVNGNLTLDGVLNITNAGGFAAGTYRLFDYTGTLTDNALTAGTLPSGFNSANLTIQTSVPNQINLIVSAVLSGQYWNGANTTPTVGVLGGTGTWNNVTTNWTDSTGAGSTNWQQGAAIFSAGSGTATLGDSITATELRFQSGSGAYTVSVPAGMTFFITGAGITNTSGITQNFLNQSGAGGGAIGTLIFRNSATVGTSVVITNQGASVVGEIGGTVQFQNTSSGGAATIINQPATLSGAAGGTAGFFQGSTAGNATISNLGALFAGGGISGSGNTFFHDTSSAGAASITNFAGTSANASGGSAFFTETATAGTATILNKGATALAVGGFVNFKNSSTAGSAQITNEPALSTFALAMGQTSVGDTASLGSATVTNKGSTIAGTEAGLLSLLNNATAGSATIISQGSQVAGGNGSQTQFKDNASAGNSTITVGAGGVVNAAGARLVFDNLATGGTSHITNSGGTPASPTGAAVTAFQGSSTAGGATILNGGASGVNGVGGDLTFTQTSNAGSALITSDGASAANGFGGLLTFQNTASAASATITNNGPSVSAASTPRAGGQTQFQDTSTAGTSIINNNGALSSGALYGGATSFVDSSTAGNATLHVFASTVPNATYGRLSFLLNSTAGAATIIGHSSTIANNSAGEVAFDNNASAGTAVITIEGGAVSGGGAARLGFSGSSTAATATLMFNGATAAGGGGAQAGFSGNSTAASAHITNGGATLAGTNGGFVSFDTNATAANATITNTGSGASGFFAGGSVMFFSATSAANATITNQGGTASGGGGGTTRFFSGSTAGAAAITTAGGQVAGAVGGITEFTGTSTAGTSTLTTNGGAGDGGLTRFSGTSSGGTARAITNLGGKFDISGLTNGGMGIGSIEGAGDYFLGGKNLTTGVTNLTATVSGTIRDGGETAGIGGSLTKVGSGTLTLSGTNTYTLNTTINAGRLLVNGSTATATTQVNSGATLGGTGLVGGLVTVANGGILAPGTSPGTLTVGALTLNSTSQVNYELGTPNVIGGGVNDLMIVNGGLTLDGVLNISNTGGFAVGTYRLFNYTGTLTDNALTFGTLPGGFTAANLTLQTSVANQINLIVAGEIVVLPGQFWNGPNTTATMGVLGGTGTWNNVATNWTDSTGAANTNWQQGVATFTAGSGTATLGENIAATELRFQPGSGAYTVATGVNTLTITGAGITNTSGITQNFVTGVNGEGSAGTIRFNNSATAGSSVTFTNNGGTVSGLNGGFTVFFDTATAGSGTFTAKGGTVSGAGGGGVEFNNTTTAGAGTFTNDGGTVSGGQGGFTSFYNTATAGNGTFTTNGGAASGTGAVTEFRDTSTAGSGHFTTNGSTTGTGDGGSTQFFDTATAGNATFTANGATVAGGGGGLIRLSDSSTAANGTFTINGGATSGTQGGVMQFFDTSTAGNATLIANGGAVGNAVLYEGGAIYFFGDSTGGTARVIVNGNGKLDIAGHNAPGVTVGSIEGNGDVYLGSRNLTVGSNNLSTTFSGVIESGGEGSGSLTKIGSGDLTLSGISTYTGDTNINGGRLSVNGSIASRNTFVNPGGTLGGTGMILGHVTNAGTVSPGNSPGTLNIAGNYTQNSNGTLQIAVAGAQPGQFSVLAVAGHASLAGALKVVKENGASLKVGDRLKIVTAVGGVSGVFSSTVNPFATGTMLGIQVIYEPNDVLLAFTQSSFAQFAALAGLTPNQTAVARVLDQIVADPRAAEVIAYLNGQPLSNVPGYLDMLSPEELTLVFHLAKSLANVQTANIQSRLAEIRGELEQILSINSVNVSIGGSRRVAPPTSSVNDERWSLWMVGSGEFTRVGSTSNAAGFDLDSGGVTAGVDYRFTEHFVAGISLGYMNTTASTANGGKVDVNGGRVGAYATYFDRGFYVDASVSGGPNSYNTRRTTPNNTAATANPGGTEVNLFLASGYDWKKGPLTFGPIASIQYTNVQLDGFTETGGFAPLSVIRKNADSMRSAVGFHASYDMKVGRAIVRPEARVSWQHEFGDTSYSLTSTFATLGGNPFTVAGPATGRDSMLVRAGVSVQCTERLSAYAYYDGELFRQNYSSNNVSVGFRLRF